MNELQDIKSQIETLINRYEQLQDEDGCCLRQKLGIVARGFGVSAKDILSGLRDIRVVHARWMLAHHLSQHVTRTKVCQFLNISRATLTNINSNWDNRRKLFPEFEPTLTKITKEL